MTLSRDPSPAFAWDAQERRVRAAQPAGRRAWWQPAAGSASGTTRGTLPDGRDRPFICRSQGPASRNIAVQQGFSELTIVGPFGSDVRAVRERLLMRRHPASTLRRRAVNATPVGPAADSEASDGQAYRSCELSHFRGMESPRFACRGLALWEGSTSILQCAGRHYCSPTVKGALPRAGGGLG